MIRRSLLLTRHTTSLNALNKHKYRQHTTCPAPLCPPHSSQRLPPGVLLHPPHHQPQRPSTQRHTQRHTTQHNTQAHNTEMFKVFLFGLLLALTPVALNFATRRAYPTPPAGGSAIVISGASTGIGYDAAVNLADDFVVYAGVRKEKDAEALRALGKPTLVPVILDVAKQESVDEAYGKITLDAAERGVPIWAIINNAGIMTGSTVEHHDVAKMQEIYEVNVWGVLRLTQKFLPVLRAQSGRIVQISSIAGFLTIPRAAGYCSSKHALESLSDGLRMELDKFNVSVTVVQPGAVKSAIFDKSLEASKTKLAEDPRELEVYGHMISDKNNDSIMEKADTPECTTRAIRHALVAKYPKTREIVANIDGLPAVVSHYMKLALPDRLLDHLLLSAFT